MPLSHVCSVSPRAGLHNTGTANLNALGCRFMSPRPLPGSIIRGRLAAGIDAVLAVHRHQEVVLLRFACTDASLTQPVKSAGAYRSRTFTCRYLPLQGLSHGMLLSKVGYPLLPGGAEALRRFSACPELKAYQSNHPELYGLPAAIPVPLPRAAGERNSESGDRGIPAGIAALRDGRSDGQYAH